MVDWSLDISNAHSHAWAAKEVRGLNFCCSERSCRQVCQVSRLLVPKWSARIWDIVIGQPLSLTAVSSTIYVNTPNTKAFISGTASRRWPCNTMEQPNHDHGGAAGARVNQI